LSNRENKFSTEDALALISRDNTQIIKSRDEVIDVVENIIANQPQVECPVTHRFTPNMYIREVFVPAGTILTSEIHKEEHPHVLSLGKITMWDGEGGEITVSAPYCGITKANARRVVLVHDNCIFTTFHVTQATNVEDAEKDIFVEYENVLMDEKVKKGLIKNIKQR
jgi:hypothetical protein